MNEQKQAFIGPLIATKAIDFALDKVLDRFAKSPNTSLEKKDVPAIKVAVEKEVVKELDARVEHVTNTEPAYQSRVTIGSSFAVLAAVAAIGQLYTDGVVNTWEDYSPHAVVIAGGLFALYGRWIAKKPIGR